MGGKEAIRGFGIQTLICLLEALERDVDWVAVTIEPDTDHDKVDILWEFHDRKKAVQVKHSQNPIGKGDIAGWCAALMKEQADEYELRIAGPLKTGALVGGFGKVKVPTPSSILLSDLSDQAVTRLDRYLEGLGIELVPGSIRTLLVNICAAKLLDGASVARRLEKKEFDGWLLHWITAAYPDALEARLAANCEVLWSVLSIGSPPTGSRAFELSAPIGFYNSGRGAAVVEWAIMTVRTGDRQMVYGTQFVDIGDKRSPFAEFAVGPGMAVERRLVFRAYEREGLASDAWPLGETEITLLVKFSAEISPRTIKTAKVRIGGDHMALLSTTGERHEQVSTMEEFIFAT